MTEVKLTPMMKQYREVKADMPDDAVLLFRLGDFYEMFFDDAARASAALDIVLTKRANIPMCGFPYHALEMHLPRLLKAGIKVAIAEQMEDPRQAKGIVKRQITRIITPGTVIDGSMLSPEENNFLVALTYKNEEYGLACLDISTGEFKITEVKGLGRLETELHRLGCRECVLPEGLYESWTKEQSFPYAETGLLWTPLDDWIFSRDCAEELLLRQFKVTTLDGFGCRDMSLAVCAAGGVMHYAAENLRRDVAHITRMNSYRSEQCLELDAISQRNLELVQPMFGTGKQGSLLHVIDFTATPMGGRKLRDWLLRPLCSRDAINARLDAVACFKDDPLTSAEIREMTAAVRDLERIVARLNMGSANARDMLALANSLSVIPGIKSLLEHFSAPLLEELNSQMDELPELTSLIHAAIKDDPPPLLTDGGIFREDYNEQLDELRSASTEGKNWLAEIQSREVERTGIKSLKVKFNKVFGYYIEISKSNLDMAPEDYTRKQTLVNAERFITPELKEIESKILGAEDKSKALEYELFQKLRQVALEYTVQIQLTAVALAGIDALVSMSEAAAKYNYVRPRIIEDETLHIIGGRHPVLDAVMQKERFVPNDVILDGDESRMMIITGPNMAGKSTYIRQVALLVIMAQMGSYVPADSAEIGLVDRIFTRVGAADDIARGQSTFMVEMVETANILNHVTPKSLIILDEIGRGTSTFDGISIAWAVAEFLHDDPRAGSRTMFATHYHELTELALTKRGVKNYNVAVREYGEQIIFLRQIIPGATDKSYGIHVAALAGLPDTVISRANEILENLENNSVGEGGQPALAEHHKTVRETAVKYQSDSKSPKKKRVPQKTEVEPEEPESFQPSLFD
jgi:DNA mismatch repair protein MutS